MIDSINIFNFLSILHSFYLSLLIFSDSFYHWIPFFLTLSVYLWIPSLLTLSIHVWIPFVPTLSIIECHSFWLFLSIFESRPFQLFLSLNPIIFWLFFICLGIPFFSDSFSIYLWSTIFFDSIYPWFLWYNWALWCCDILWQTLLMLLQQSIVLLLWCVEDLQLLL